MPERTTNKVKCAVKSFREGFSCSQAILSTFGPQFGLNRKLSLKIAAPFGVGMGRMGEICGAVTGAFMVIGLKYGRTNAKDENKKEKAYNLVNKFSEKFKSYNGSIVCKKLLNCDVSTPEGMELANEKKLIKTLCPKFVQNAAEIIEEILE